MDINRLMRKLDRHLGLSTLQLEKFYPRIQEVLNDDTLRTLSQFFPYNYMLKLDLSQVKDGENLGNGEYIYYLTDKYIESNDNIDIISVRRVTGAGTFEQWNAPLQTFNIDAMILEAQASNIRSLANISTKAFEFLPPNRIKLKGFGSHDTIYVECKITYPSWGAVPESISIAAEQLAKLDVKTYLWNELKLYDKLESADGAIDLKIDDWANAENERQELLDNWRNKAFPNMVKYPYTYE